MNQFSKGGFGEVCRHSGLSQLRDGVVEACLWCLVGRGQECHLTCILQCTEQIPQQRIVWTQMSIVPTLGNTDLKGSLILNNSALSVVTWYGEWLGLGLWGKFSSGWEGGWRAEGTTPTWIVVEERGSGGKWMGGSICLAPEPVLSCWTPPLICSPPVCGVLPLLRTLPLAPLTPIPKVGTPTPTPRKVLLYFPNYCRWRSMPALHWESKNEGRGHLLQLWQSLLILRLGAWALPWALRRPHESPFQWSPLQPVELWVPWLCFCIFFPTLSAFSL